MIRRALGMVCGAFALVTLLSSSPGASAAGEPPRIPVRIGWQVPAATQGQPVAVLERTNVMEAHGLEPRLVPFSFGDPQPEAAIRGTLPFGSSAQREVMLAKAMATLAAHPQEDVEVILPSARETPPEDVTARYPFDALPLWVLFLVLMATSALAIEAGRWAGGWRRTEADQASDAVSTAVGAILALLAFVIALTFAAASTRFDARKQALLDEVNAIHTAYLRLGLLPEPHRTTTQSLLRDYVEVRLGLYRAYESPERLQLIRGRTEALQVSIWSHVVELVEVDRDSAIYALVAAGLNRVYDLNTTRVVLGAEYRIPLVVWYTLGLASWLAMAALGFHFGIGGRRSLRAGFAVSLMFALVILLVIELDRPGEGLIEVNQQPMRDLYHTLSQ